MISGANPRKTTEASNAYLAGRSGPLNDREFRLIMETVASSYQFDPLAIIEPWIPDAEELGVDDAQQCVDAIPDADLPRALLALVDPVEAKDLDEAKTEIGCSDCDLYQDPIEGCDGPQEVKR